MPPACATLLAGDVDMIENPPPAGMKKLRENPNVKISDVVSNRLIYISLDVGEPTAGIPDTDGKNPLRNVRVPGAVAGDQPRGDCQPDHGGPGQAVG